MTAKLITKVPIVHSDIAIGFGTVQQQRGPIFEFEQRIELNWIFRTVDEIKELDIDDKYTRISLHTLGPLQEYYYDDNSTATPDDVLVIKPNQVSALDSGRWIYVPPPVTGIEEAPSDDAIYGRQNETWVEISTGGGTYIHLPLSSALT